METEPAVRVKQKRTIIIQQNEQFETNLSRKGWPLLVRVERTKALSLHRQKVLHSHQMVIQLLMDRQLLKCLSPPRNTRLERAMLLVLASYPNKLNFSTSDGTGPTKVHESARLSPKNTKKKIADHFHRPFETFDAVLIYPQAGCPAFVCLLWIRLDVDKERTFISLPLIKNTKNTPPPTFNSFRHLPIGSRKHYKTNKQTKEPTLTPRHWSPNKFSISQTKEPLARSSSWYRSS